MKIEMSKTMSTEPELKNFSYTAYMHLGSYEKHHPNVNNVLQTFEDIRKNVSDKTDIEHFRTRHAELVAAVVMFRLHVHYSVQLKSFSTPMKCTSCQVGLCKCACHDGDPENDTGEDVSMYEPRLEETMFGLFILNFI